MPPFQHLLAKQEIMHVEQKIEWLEKIQIEYHDTIHLYEDMIKTSQQRYPLQEVFDISYRWTPGQIGFLYIHTTSGIRTFHIKSDPSHFIQQFRRTSHL